MSILEIAQDNRFVSVERGFLVISRHREELGRIPLDMLDAVIVTGHGITYTNNALLKLCQHDVPVIICGENYHPAGIVTGMALHYKQTERLEYQIAAGKPLKKQLWKTIVQHKIRHQMYELERAGKQSKSFETLLNKVRSGDPDNIEAQAAQRYWKRLFGTGFNRDPNETGINAFLNYGYAVIRGAVARFTVGSGLHPSIGIHHHNKLNPFCLVDDLMEPFRPLVDRTVFALFAPHFSHTDLPLTPDYKKELAGILEHPIYTAGEESTVNNGIQKFVWSYVESLSSGKCLLLEFEEKE